MADPKNAASDEEEDDYLNFTFTDPAPKQKESSIQRTARLKKESLARGQIQSKAEKERLATEAREKALATALPTTASKGAAMMAKMGHRPGAALGAKGNEGRVNPIEVTRKDDRGGIGMDAEKKRKIRELAEKEEEGVKKVKLSAEEFRVQQGREREEKRCEGMWWGSMKVLEGFEEDGGSGREGGEMAKTKEKRRLKDVNLLYRPLVASRQNAETERLARSKLLDSLSQPSLRTSNLVSDLNDEETDLSNETEDDNIDSQDPELEEYEALPASEKLEKVVKHLRKEWRYCFWCKFRYPDEEMDGCPGEDEDSHG